METLQKIVDRLASAMAVLEREIPWVSWAAGARREDGAVAWEVSAVGDENRIMTRAFEDRVDAVLGRFHLEASGISYGDALVAWEGEEEETNPPPLKHTSEPASDLRG